MDELYETEVDKIESHIDNLVFYYSLKNKKIIEKSQRSCRLLYSNEDFGLWVRFFKDKNRGKCRLTCGLIKGDTSIHMSYLLPNSWRETLNNFGCDVASIVHRASGKFDENGKIDSIVTSIREGVNSVSQPNNEPIFF